MSLWRLGLCLAFLAVVLSDDIPESSQIVQYKNIKFHQYQQKYASRLKELARKLTRATDDEQVAILNEYSDEVLSNLNAWIITNAYDPVEIPAFEASFKWGFFTGWVTLEDGWLNGLSTFQRTNDVIVRYSYPNVKIRVPLGFSNLAFKYYYEMKFMHLGPDGTASGTSKGNKFTVDLDLNMVTLRAKLDKFDLHTLGKVSLKFSGSILTDWIVNLAVAAIMPILKPILAMVIESYVVDGLEYILGTYNDIICNILADCPAQLTNVVYQHLS